MSNIKSAFREAADRHRPPVNWLDRIHERAQRKRQRQRIAAGVLALAVFFALAVVLIRQVATEGRTVPAGRPSVAPARNCGSGTDVRPTGWWTGDGTPAGAGGHDAIFHGDTSFAPGFIGDAFTFDGHGDWAEVPDDPALNVGSGDFTVALWVRLHSKKGEQIFVEDWVQRGRYDSVGWTLTKVASGGILFTLEPGAEGVGTGRLDLPLNTWIHLAARRRAGTLSVLVNGEVVATEAVSDTQGSVDSPASLKFGHRGGSRDTPGALLDQRFFLDGELDEILFFVGRGLSDAQIRRIFETQSACGM